MNIRYEVATWVNGEPRLSYKSGLNWKTWGRRRAYDLALHLIREYEDQGVTDYEIAVYSRGGGLVWAWNACQAREAYARGEPYIGIQPADLVHPVDMVHRVRESLTDDPVASKMRALLAEWQREWDALPWHAKLRRRFESWREEVFPKKRFFTDEQIAQFPALGETQREWDALPRREKLRQRFDSSREHGLFNDLSVGWSRAAVAGVGLFAIFLFVAAPIIKFVVPGGSEWLQRNIGTVMLLCLAPLVLGIALYFVAGWVALPFWLGRGLWRRLRGYESEKAEASQSREAAINKGVVEHRLGVDDFEQAKKSLAEGKYVVFDVDEWAESASEEENREDEELGPGQ
jgi:hypothetical protein